MLDDLERHDRLMAWLMRPGADFPDVSTLLDRPAWMARAACRGADRSVFFPGRRSSGDAAKAVCARCPVRAQCLDMAMADTSVVGVWGGTTESERRAMRRVAA